MFCFLTQIRFGPCAVVPSWQPKHSGTQFGGSDVHGFIQAMTEWWMMTQSDILVHTGTRPAPNLLKKT
jgi:hypothetical protein